VLASAQPAGLPEGLSPSERGRAIAEEAERRREGFGDSATELTMTLIGENGRTRTRRLTWRTLEGASPGEGDKSLTIFHEPRDIAGTAFVSHTYVGRSDEQWLYLPSLRRVRRIAPANQSSAFVGSEFSYEDLLSDEVERFDYQWLGDEPCDDTACFVVERYPTYDNSGYVKQIVWIDQSEYRPMKVEFYDRRDRLEKTLMLDDYRLHLDRFWRAHRMTMENHLTGRSTILTFGPFEFRTGLGGEDFDPSVLRRLR
jgi:hypothetical protein